jgi:hypothetical protein
MHFLPRMPSRYLVATRRVDVLTRHMSFTPLQSDPQEVATIHSTHQVSLLNSKISSPLSSLKRTLQHVDSSSTGPENSMPLIRRCSKPWHLESRYPLHSYSLFRTPPISFCLAMGQFRTLRCHRRHCRRQSIFCRW